MPAPRSTSAPPSAAAALRRILSLAVLSLAVSAPLAADVTAVGSVLLRQSPTGDLTGPEGDQDTLGDGFATGDFDGDGFDDLAVFEWENVLATSSGVVHVVYGDADGLSGDDDQTWYDFDPATLLMERETGDLFGYALAAGDFNDDAFDDLAIGVPGEDVGTEGDAGSLTIVYGSSLGLQTGFEPGTVAPKRFQLGTGGIGGGPPLAGERFGWVLESADFNGDGRDDLAVGIPDMPSGTGESDAGSVLVLYGGASGLAAAGHVFLDQDSNIGGHPMLGATNTSDFFGLALAAGDFNGDDLADLAVGVPWESSDLSDCPAASGAVQILYGTLGTGLLTAGNQLWYEGNVATGGTCELNDQFGRVLAAGDLTGDGVDDLVIGAPFENLAAVEDAGAITFLVGLDGVGIATPASELLFESDFAGFGNAQLNDNFGAALAIGDFTEDIVPGRADLAIGIPSDNVWNGFMSVADAGSVVVTIGGPGLGPSSARLFAPGLGGAAGTLTIHDFFGSALAAGDFDADGDVDLAIGAPAADDSFVNSGAVFLLRGSLFADGFESGTSGAWSGVAP